MMAGNETTRRRRGQRRLSGTEEVSSTSITSRTSSLPDQQQPQHHHHDHHHHHYHFHHHYHHFPRPINRNQEQGLLLSSPSGGSFVAPSVESSSDASHDNRHRSIGRRPSLLSSLFSAITSREAATGGRDHAIDETLRTSAAIQSHRPGFRESFLEDFNLLFEDEEDGWSEDELMEIGIQEWLAALDYGEEEGAPSASSEQGGLSKYLIRRLHKEVYVPEMPQTSEEVLRVSSSPEQQQDCSVCLERFVSGQLLICLPCNHRFHPDCVTPWLESHGKCPYCRTKVRVEGGGACAATAAAGGSGLSSSSTSRSGSGRSLVEDDLIAWMEAVDSGLSQFRIR